MIEAAWPPATEESPAPRGRGQARDPAVNTRLQDQVSEDKQAPVQKELVRLPFKSTSSKEYESSSSDLFGFLFPHHTTPFSSRHFGNLRNSAVHCSRRLHLFSSLRMASALLFQVRAAK